MYSLPARNKKILFKKIRQYKKRCFPGKGSGARLAEEIGVSRQTVSNWLAGNRTPTFEQLYRLAKAFNTSPFELCGIRGAGKAFQHTDDIAALRSVLDVLEHGIKHHVNPRVTAKILKSINYVAFNEIIEIKNTENNADE